MLKPRLAIVDDELDVIETYKELLGDKYFITEFISAQSYLAFLHNETLNPFDLLITDYKLGQMNGIQMIQKAKDLGKECPFILMSGYLDKSTALSAHNLGAHRILEKPVAIEKLETQIRELIFENQLDRIRRENTDLALKLKEVCGVLDKFLDQFASRPEFDNFFNSLNLNRGAIQGPTFREYLRSIEDEVQRNLKKEEIFIQQLRQLRRP